jgi:hypothetical protein
LQSIVTGIGATLLGGRRTFAWMICWRRLVRDYKQRVDVSKAMIHVWEVFFSGE